MSTNASTPSVLILETLGLSDASIYPALVFASLTYGSIMFFNLLLITTIVVTKKLQKPMFILLINLPLGDMTGATAFFPQMILSISAQSRAISYPACVTQAFLIHFYGTGNLLILTAMAYDRYVAICFPLRYNAIMTPQKLTYIVIAVWMISFLIIGTLIFMLVRLKLCRTSLVDLFCNNPSLLKLVCENTAVNNIYGLIFMVLLQGGTAVLVMYSYAQILRTCLMTKQTTAQRKAIQTCGTHLVVFLILQINTMVTLISHRIDNLDPYVRRLLGVSILVFPPFLDPIIYGFKITELRQSIQMFLRIRGPNVQQAKRQ